MKDIVIKGEDVVIFRYIAKAIIALAICLDIRNYPTVVILLILMTMI